MKSQNEDLGIDLKDLEVKIEKYPLAESPNLIENFLILGYEESYIQEIILKKLQLSNLQIENEKTEVRGRKGSDIKLCFKEYKCRNYPTILGTISSNFTGGIFNGSQIIEQVFPVPPSVYYGYFEYVPSTQDFINSTNIIFSNIQNEAVNIGYAHIFHESRNICKLKVYIPKAFVIISQYPYFNIFHNLCKEIKRLYSNEQLQIPIEIQLYNIVNFVPAPIDSSMKMTLIPAEELFEINRIKSQEDFFESKKQEKYYLSQLSGYRCSDINFSELFSVLSVETIVEVYLELLSGKIIGFFSKYLEILNITIYIFKQFLFPFSPNENASGLSPTKFFCSENIDEYIVGFVCGFDDLDNYNPLREIKEGEFRCLSDEEEKQEVDLLIFKCNYILDLDKKILKEQDKYSYGMEISDSKKDAKLSEYFKKVIGGSVNANSYLDVSIDKLLTKLKDISFKLTSYKTNTGNLPNFFHSTDNNSSNTNTDNNSNEILNRAILDSFYQFNLNIAYLYYSRVSTYNGDYRISKEEEDVNIKTKEQSGLNDDEYLFFSEFRNSLFCNGLGNFIGGYSYKDPKIYKASKRIFEKLLALKKVSGGREEYFYNILDIYDSVYLTKNKSEPEVENNFQKKVEKFSKKEEKKNSKKNEMIQENNIIKKEDKYKTTITFLEFYKYYFNSPKMASYFYSIINEEFVKGTINKKNKINIKYLYKYKKIDIDQNLLFKYIYMLNVMDNSIKKKCFKLTEDVQIEQNITSRMISSDIEHYYINTKLIDYKDLLKFSILSVVALTASKHKLLHFTPQIYQIIGKLNFSVRKFVEIILSISLRLFSNEEEKNLYIYEKYFNLYNEAIEKRGMFPNDELIILEKKINEFTNKIQNTREVIEQQEYRKMINLKEKDRYTLDFDKKRANEIKAPSYSFGTNEVKVKITFKVNKKKVAYLETCYSFITIYDKITSILNQYYKDLDYSKIDKNEYNKIIIYLIYFTTIFSNDYKDFPKDTSLFLFYCLDLDKLSNIK